MRSRASTSMAATPPASIASTNSARVANGKSVAAPQAEPLRIGEIVHRGGAGRRDVEHAGIRQRVLQAQARTSLLGWRLVAAFALAAGGVLHGVALVEDDHSVEVGAQPIDDLVHPRNLFLARVGP